MAEQEQNQVEISGEEFNEWVNNKITKAVVNEIMAIRDNLSQYLISGGSLAKDSDITTDRAVGRIEGITHLFNIFTETKEELREKPSYGH